MKALFKKFICITALIFAFINTFPGSVLASGKGSKITPKDMIYFIMTDRFKDGDTSNNQGVNKGDPGAYHGGDFQGIIDELDYIKDLGFTAIWISPVVKNQIRGYHGYWASDFYDTNEHFGSMEKLKELVQKAHSKDMKVIVDLVINHTGQLHPWVGETDYADWFHPKKSIVDYGNQEEVEDGWLSNLPDLDQDNPKVREYLIDMSKWWIKETGIDGYRLDTVRHVPKDFWVDFAAQIKKDYPDFYLIGEVFSGDVDYVGRYQKTGIDGLLDFPIYYGVNDVFKNYKPASEIGDLINKSSVYENRCLMGTFIDNHDVPRFVNQIDRGQYEKLKQALVFMMTYTGIPVMYYGTEIAMDGGADPDNRRDMDWNLKSPVSEYVKKLTEIRKSNSVFTGGDIKVLKAENNFLCYSRKDGSSKAFVAFNTSNLQKEFEFTIPEEDQGKYSKLKDLLGSQDVKVTGNKVILKMLPLQSAIYVPEYDESIALRLYIAIIICVAATAVFAAAMYVKNKNRIG